MENVIRFLIIKISIPKFSCVYDHNWHQKVRSLHRKIVQIDSRWPLWRFFLSRNHHYLRRKTKKKAFWFSILKVGVSINFMCLRFIKTEKMCQEVETLNRKMIQNWFKTPTLNFFFLQNHSLQRKTKKVFWFSIIK